MCRKTQGQLERLVELLGAYTSTVLTDRLIEEATGGELTPAQLDALGFIQRHGGCSVKTLSEGLRISIPSATRLVDRLVRKKLVDRRESGVDRRLVTLLTTPVGEAALLAIHKAHLQRLEHALHAFQPEEREQLFNMLERFLLTALDNIEMVEDCCLRCGTDHDGQCVVNEAHIALVGRPIEHP